MYGLKLAIPFEDIEGAIKLSNVTLSFDNDRNWILGEFRSATMGTHIVDTAQMLFGDNYDPAKSNYNEMIVLAGKHWSIVIDKVIKAQCIPFADVAENQSPQFRPWLTGTYSTEKCALVNVHAMVRMFEDELNI
jgi:purine-binding chemotaxis protein CheW